MSTLPQPEPPPPPPSPPWTGGDVLLIAALGLVTIFLFSGVALAIALSLPAFDGVPVAEAAGHPLVIIPGQSAAYLLILILVYAVLSRRTDAPFWDALRWRWPALPSVLAYLLLGVALSVGVQLASQVLPIPRDLPIQRMFRDPAAAWLLLLFGTLLAPLMEEVFFRGLLYPVLARRLGAAIAVAATAASFAVIHSPQLGAAWAPLLLLFSVGLAITLVRAHTGSVAAGFLVHVAYNALIFLLILLRTEGFRHLDRLAAIG